MEALIFGLVIMAVSAFFNKSKKDSADGDVLAKPVSTKASTDRGDRSGQGRFKRVEDYAKEIYGELQNQKSQGSERVGQAKKKAEEMVNRAPLREARQEVQRQVTSRDAQNEIQDRISTHRSKPLRDQPIIQNLEEQSDEFLPLSNEDVRRGIIMAEILMPPKSKR